MVLVCDLNAVSGLFIKDIHEVFELVLASRRSEQ